MGTLFIVELNLMGTLSIVELNLMGTLSVVELNLMGTLSIKAQGDKFLMSIRGLNQLKQFV